jgi:hypothetical protein
MNPHRREIEELGYTRIAQVMPRELLARLQRYTGDLLDALPEAERLKQVSTGSMVSVWQHPVMADLIALPAALAALADLGWPQAKISGGYIISKPPHSPRLFWHYDYTGWADPDAFMLPPQQLFLMWYLTDTRPENGCLRVIPRSHLADNPLLPLLREAHTDDLRRGHGQDLPEFSDRPDEVNVCVQAGDLVVGDSRLLHAAHANDSEQRRTVITLWYHPDVAALPERTQALVASLHRPPQPPWPAEAWAKVAPLVVRYHGPAEPYPRTRLRPCPRPR